MITPKSKSYDITDSPESFITHLEKWSSEGAVPTHFHAADVRALCSIVRRLQAEIAELKALQLNPPIIASGSFLGRMASLMSQRSTLTEYPDKSVYTVYNPDGSVKLTQTTETLKLNNDGSMAVTDEPKDIQEDRQFLKAYARDYATQPITQVPQAVKVRYEQAAKSVADYDKTKADTERVQSNPMSDHYWGV